MLQSYTLRLGDGTVLQVDEDGLRGWLEDARATVQVAGTQEWRPLREFLADMDSAARLARALVPPAPRRAPAPAGPAVPPGHGSGEAAGETPIRLKPLGDESPRHPVPWARSDEEEEDEEQRHDRLEGPLLQVLSTLGSFLSRCLDPLTPLVRGGPARSTEEPPAPRAARVSPSATPRPPAPATRAPLEAPAPVSELPVLRFAEPREAGEGGDVYEEEEESRNILPVVWRWAKRLVAAGVLVGGGVLIGLNWRIWFPRAAEVGETVFTEIDRQARSGERARELEQALGGASERLPHLAPGTIRLVLSASRGGVPEPPEVFQLAAEAADRGRSALTAAEAADLLALQRELLTGLSPSQRRRLEEYERARATRGVFPFENPYALDLVARGARAMPEARRRRLQELLGKAVAAGLAAPAASP